MSLIIQMYTGCLIHIPLKTWGKYFVQANAISSVLPIKYPDSNHGIPFFNHCLPPLFKCAHFTCIFNMHAHYYCTECRNTYWKLNKYWCTFTNNGSWFHFALPTVTISTTEIGRDVEWLGGLTFWIYLSHHHIIQ